MRQGKRATPHSRAIDEHVGARVRLRRTLMGMSQEKLGEAIDLTFQQIQKYERGANRIGASKLWDLAHVLDVPISFFFDGLSSEGVSVESVQQVGRFDMEMSKATSRITDEKVRDRLLSLAKALGPMDQPTQ